MFLVLKRFPMDDVPIVLTKTKPEAMIHVGADQIKGKYATSAQQALMQCDIGLPYCNAHLVVEFNSDGKPISSQIIRCGG